MSTIGRSIPRLEDDRLLTGRGRFTDDVRLDRQVWCAFLRSPHAHARLAGIRTEGVKGPGVLSVLTSLDYMNDGLGPIDHLPNPLAVFDVDKKAFSDPREAPQWPLAHGEVRHVGEAVAAVVAESLEAARDAVERIEVDYEPLPLQETACLTASYGDAEATRDAFAGAPVTVRQRFHHQRVANSQMEPRAAVGEYGNGFYTLTSGCCGRRSVSAGR